VDVLRARLGIFRCSGSVSSLSCALLFPLDRRDMFWYLFVCLSHLTFRGVGPGLYTSLSLLTPSPAFFFSSQLIYHVQPTLILHILFLVLVKSLRMSCTNYLTLLAQVWKVLLTIIHISLPSRLLLPLSILNQYTLLGHASKFKFHTDLRACVRALLVTVYLSPAAFGLPPASWVILICRQ
jgi:hypothetical protein